MRVVGDRLRLAMAVLWVILQVVVGGVLLIGLMTAVYVGVILAIGWIHIDALSQRRWPWLTRPLMVALDTLFIVGIIRDRLDARRKRRELPGKLRARELRCPLCGSPLPAFDGRFEGCPFQASSQHGGGMTEGSFRLRCGACGRDAWFTARLDGTVRPHFGWMWEMKDQYEC